MMDSKAACQAEPYCSVPAGEAGAGWGPTDGLSEGLLYLLPPELNGEAAATVVAGRSEYAEVIPAGPVGLPSGSSPNCSLSGALCSLVNGGML